MMEKTEGKESKPEFLGCSHWSRHKTDHRQNQLHNLIGKENGEIPHENTWPFLADRSSALTGFTEKLAAGELRLQGRRDVCPSTE